MVWNVILKYLLISCWYALGPIALFAALYFNKTNPHNSLAVVDLLFAAVVCLISFVMIIRSFLLYSFVSPLAVERVISPLKNSRFLMRGNVWRMIGNILLLVLLIYLPAFALRFVISYSGLIDYPDSLLLTLGCSIVLGGETALAVILSSAFYCSACRICYHEKQQANPGFVLIAKA